MGDVQGTAADEATAGRPYTLVVAVANPGNVDQLMRTAVDLAADRGGRIRVVSVAHKPVTSPFALFSDDSIRTEFSADREAVLDAAVDAAADSPVPVERTLAVGTDVSDALLDVVGEADADALLLGWHHRSRPTDVVLGRTVDRVVRRAPCDVYVERVGTTADGMDAILAPTDGGPHVEPAVDLAGAVGRATDATVRVVSYVAPAAGSGDRAAAREHVDRAVARLSGVPVDGTVQEADDVAGAVVAAAEDHDLVVLGATRERRRRGRVVGSVAEAVGRRASPPIVIAKRSSGGSLLDRVLDRWKP